MSLKTRFLALTVLFSFFIVLSCIALLIQNDKLSYSRANIESDWEETKLLSRIEQKINQVHGEFETKNIDADIEFVDQTLSEAESLLSQINDYTQVSSDGNEGEMVEFKAVESLESNLDRWKEFNHSPRNSDLDHEVFLSEMNSIYSESFGITAEYREGAYEEFGEALELMTDSEALIQYYITRGTLVLLLALSLSWFGFGYWLLRPIRRLNSMINRVKERKYDRINQIRAGGELGEVINSFWGLVQEIQRFTGELEERVQRRTQELENSRKQLRQMLDGLPGAAVALTGSNNHIIMSNKSYQEMKGESMESLLPEILNSPRQPRGFYEWKKDSKTLILDVQTVKLQDSVDGQPVTLEYINNLTHQVEIESALASSQKLAALGRFSSSISHEINNPLTAVAACSEGLLKRLEKGNIDQEIFNEYLTTIRDEVYRCKDITGKLLQHSGKSSTEIELCDPAMIIKDLLLLIGNVAEKKNVAIQFLEDSSITARTSPQAIRQIMMNLLLNSIEACDHDGIINIMLSQQNNQFLLEVTDDGAGISEQNIDRLFEPFFTNRKDDNGTGLGLYVCQSLVESLNGTISVRSEGQGKGASFTVTLPTNYRQNENTQLEESNV